MIIIDKIDVFPTSYVVDALNLDENILDITAPILSKPQAPSFRLFHKATNRVFNVDLTLIDTHSNISATFSADFSRLQNGEYTYLLLDGTVIIGSGILRIIPSPSITNSITFFAYNDSQQMFENDSTALGFRETN